jgi:hypothetical protein
MTIMVFRIHRRRLENHTYPRHTAFGFFSVFSLLWHAGGIQFDVSHLAVGRVPMPVPDFVFGKKLSSRSAFGRIGEPAASVPTISVVRYGDFLPRRLE